ncbi:MAG TPA: hypothetical protein GXX64_05420, partial [Bacteroidales bacterium]|nr:hypothetical protein [Bacteroidales bacterium]
MAPELIIQLIATLIGTGGLVALFLITEKKAAAQLANTEKVNEQWQLIVAGGRFLFCDQKQGNKATGAYQCRNQLDNQFRSHDV